MVGPARVPCGRGAERRAVERDREALEAAPGRADAEQRQRIDEGVRGLVRHRLEHDAEQAGRAGEIALPDRMPGIGLERRMQHARDLGARREPSRDRERRLLMMHQPHLHGAQAAQREEHVLRPGADRHACRRSRADPASSARSPRPCRAAGRTSRCRYFVPASIAMSTPRACGGKNSGVAQVLSISTIGVARMRGRCDRRNVLHLERQRARRLGEHRARIRLEQARDAGAEQRIVIGRLDAEALQQACRRNSASAGRPSPAPADGRPPSGRRAAQSRSPRARRAPARCRPRRTVRSRRPRASRWSACPWCRRCSARRA